MNEVELGELERKLAALGIAGFQWGDDSDVEELFGDVDEAVLDEFVGRLDRTGVAADVYLPLAFDRPFRVRGVQCVSARALVRALDALRPELGLDDDESERAPKLARQRNLWKRFRRGARRAINKRHILELVRL